MKKATCCNCGDEYTTITNCRYVKCSCGNVMDMDDKICNTCDFQVGTNCNNESCSVHQGFNDIEPTGWRQRHV